MLQQRDEDDEDIDSSCELKMLIFGGIDHNFQVSNKILKLEFYPHDFELQTNKKK